MGESKRALRREWLLGLSGESELRHVALYGSHRLIEMNPTRPSKGHLAFKTRSTRQFICNGARHCRRCHTPQRQSRLLGADTHETWLHRIFIERRSG